MLLVVVNNGINYDKGVQITGKTQISPETLASISRDTKYHRNISELIPKSIRKSVTIKPPEEDESVSRSWALFMEAGAT